jgi:hypothetical protein
MRTHCVGRDWSQDGRSLCRENMRLALVGLETLDGTRYT